MEPVEKTFVLNSDDEEIQAIEIMKVILSELDAQAQDRVMMYLQSWMHSDRGELLGLAAQKAHGL